MRKLFTTLTLWLLGASFAFTIASGFVATTNFKVTAADQLRNADTVFAPIESGEPRRLALRYVASELNRHMFQTYATTMMAITVAILFSMAIAGVKSRIAWVSLFLLLPSSIYFATYLTPMLTDMGRVIDFMPRDPKPPEVISFYQWHVVSLLMEFLRLLLLLTITLGVHRHNNRPIPQTASV